jgi:hypothetical protein
MHRAQRPMSPHTKRRDQLAGAGRSIRSVCCRNDPISACGPPASRMPPNSERRVAI